MKRLLQSLYCSLLGGSLFLTASAHGQGGLDNIGRSLDRSLEAKLERATPVESNILSQSEPAAIFNNPPAVARLQSFSAQQSSVAVSGGKAQAAPLFKPSSWDFSISSETLATYDTNATGVSDDGPDDWHVDEELTLAAAYTINEKLSLNLLGIYSGSRYDTFESEDYDSLTTGGGLAYRARPTTTIKLNDVVSWFYESDFGDDLFTKNRLSLAATENLAAHLQLQDWALNTTASVRWEDYDGGPSDRVRGALNLEAGRKLGDKVTFSIGATESYTDLRSGGHYWDTEVYGEVGYQLTKNIALAARAYYLHRSKDDADVDQATFAPVLGLSATF